MAGVYKAGTLYVDVVPSMKGFFKTVEADAKAQLPNIGQNAGKDFANGLRSGVGTSGAQVAKSISQPLDAAASDVKNSVNAMTKGLQSSTSGMQRAADGAGRSLSKMGAEAGRARGPVDSAARALDGAASSAGSAAGSMRDAGSGFSSMAGFAQNAIAPLAALAAAVGIGGFVSEAIAASDATQKFADTLKFAGIDTDRIEELGAAAQKYADETSRTFRALLRSSLQTTSRASTSSQKRRATSTLSQAAVRRPTSRLAWRSCRSTELENLPHKIGTRSRTRFLVPVARSRRHCSTRVPIPGISATQWPRARSRRRNSTKLC